LLIGPDARQQSLARARTVPAYLRLSFPVRTVRARKDGDSLRGQYFVLPKDLAAFFTMLQMSLQFGQLERLKAARSRQCAKLFEFVMLVATALYF
jgi:hypothetical protein